MVSRILALDYGTKRIGVALSDELGWTAQPLETFERRTLDRDIAHIASLVQSHEVGKVVLGLPLQLDGRQGPASQAMHQFAAKLEEGISVPIVLWDERMTTKAAEGDGGPCGSRAAASKLFDESGIGRNDRSWD